MRLHFQCNNLYFLQSNFQYVHTISYTCTKRLTHWTTLSSGSKIWAHQKKLFTGVTFLKSVHVPIWKMIQDYSPTVQSCLHYSIKFERLCEVWILSIQAGKKLSLYLMFVGKRASWCTIKWRMYVYISRNTLVHFFWWTSTSWNQAEMGHNMYQSCSKNLTNYGLVIHLEMYQSSMFHGTRHNKIS